MIRLGIYQHYKGNYYQVLAMSRHSETLEELVVYQALYGDFGIWVRPRAMFTEDVTVPGRTAPRFQFISEGVSKSPSFSNDRK